MTISNIKYRASNHTIKIKCIENSVFHANRNWDKMTEFLSLCDVLFNVVSLAGYFCDVVFDVVLSYALFERGHFMYMWVVIVLVVVSLIISQVIIMFFFKHLIVKHE